ncbi:MAG: alanine--tRNA ligase, partial [Deltaproteobacteria bacterium]
FSFGDYFKEDAIRYAWEFLTGVLGLPPEKLWVSVFEEDDEAYNLWEKIENLPEGRIIRLGEKDNFWAMGDTGPCGPCSEILIDQGEEVGCQTADCKAGCDCDRYLELWNLVFMQFYRDADGTLAPLPKPSIDTGMGLERIAAVVQGVYTNYDSDIFAPIIAAISKLAGKGYGESGKQDTAMRVIADHSRAAAFLIADGVLPSNEGRGYVLRRLLRRAIRYGRTLGFNGPFLAEVAETVVQQMQETYPHLPQAGQLMSQVINHEEKRFFATIDKGLDMLQQEISRLRKAKENRIDGAFMFKLYDTYGFPVDIVRDIALEHGISLDEGGYNAAMEERRQQSKKSWKAGGLAGLDAVARVLSEQPATVFVGYETKRHQSVIGTMLSEEGEQLEQAGAGERLLVVCPETSFYAESGGQIGDQGEIVGPNGRARVVDTVKLANGVFLHKAELEEGLLAAGDTVELLVQEGRRQQIANNHTATHLLHAALRQILGEHVKQSGSLVEAERLRFDFTHYSPLSKKELHRVEDIVNAEIRANTRMGSEVLELEEARRQGATALFGEKYGEQVRMVSIGEVSKELCGGTHVGATGEIGFFKIVSETGIAAGTRRIEAVTGIDALAHVRNLEHTLDALSVTLKTSPAELQGKAVKLVERQRELEREVSQLNARLSLVDLDQMINRAQMVGEERLITARVTLDSPKTLREVGDRVRAKMGRAIAVLGGEFEGKAALLVLVSEDLVNRYNAGKIVAELAQVVGGRGGGRADMAQAGGPRPEKLDEALRLAVEIVGKMG